MDDFESKINKVLSDPGAMDKVMNMARSLSAGDSGNSGSSGPESAIGESAGTPDLSGLLGGLMGGGEGGLGNIDPALISKAVHLLGVYNQGADPQKAAVLKAIKPYLRPERQERVDTALQTLRLAHVAKEALGEDIFSKFFPKK